jgi:Cu+-exporting ATPase
MSATTDRQQVTLDIGGMTCASCAMRIEKRLNKLEGVTATVNYALEQASVTAPDGVSVEDLVSQVEAAGYTARPPKPTSGSTSTSSEDDQEDDTAPLRNRFVISLVLSLPVVALAMVPSLQFENWQWLSLTLAAPVVVWGALPFHRAAWANLRHATATMDTLISVGVIAAAGWSLWALFFGEAGTPGMKMSFRHRTRLRDARDLPRSGHGRDRVHPRGPLLRVEGEASVRRSAAGFARAGSERRRRAP